MATFLSPTQIQREKHEKMLSWYHKTTNKNPHLALEVTLNFSDSHNKSKNFLVNMFIILVKSPLSQYNEEGVLEKGVSVQCKLKHSHSGKLPPCFHAWEADVAK